jgi:hypothetical protein
LPKFLHISIFQRIWNLCFLSSSLMLFHIENIKFFLMGYPKLKRTSEIRKTS